MNRFTSELGGTTPFRLHGGLVERRERHGLFFELIEFEYEVTLFPLFRLLCCADKLPPDCCVTTRAGRVLDSICTRVHEQECYWG